MIQIFHINNVAQLPPPCPTSGKSIPLGCLPARLGAGRLISQHSPH